MPLLEVASPLDGGTALVDSLAQLDNYDWILFTSTNAVDAVVEAFDRRWPDRPRVGSVGAATTRRLQEFGIGVHFTSEASTAAHLGESVPIKAAQRVLAPLGDRAGAALGDALEARGAIVTRVEAYRTLWTEPNDEARVSAIGADYVFLTSPAIAERFSTVVKGTVVGGTVVGGTVGAGPKAVCIGPTTAQAAERLGLNVIAVATKRGPDGLISALVNTMN